LSQIGRKCDFERRFHSYENKSVSRFSAPNLPKIELLWMMICALLFLIFCNQVGGDFIESRPYFIKNVVTDHLSVIMIMITEIQLCEYIVPIIFLR